MNWFQPLCDSDLDVVNNCHSVEVNTIVTDTEGTASLQVVFADAHQRAYILKSRDCHVAIIYRKAVH